MKTKYIGLYGKVLVGLHMFCLFSVFSFGQVPANINSGDPNFPFPQFKEYTGGANTLANQNPVGVPHAELEQRTRDAYAILCNNMTYDVLQGATYAPLTVNGVKYIMPNQGNGSDIDHCRCVEGDAYYLLAAAYMGDKTTFDGYYMWVHDRGFQKTRRFVDNVMNSPLYNGSPGISGSGAGKAFSLDVYGGGTSSYTDPIGQKNGNSATDGDVDMALALLVAWKQWGDAGVICNDPQLGTITYKAEAIKYIKTMVDTVAVVYFDDVSGTYKRKGTHLSGVVGFDGYLKFSDAVDELTSWATPGYMGIIPDKVGGQLTYVDYHAPAYFRAFGDMLQAEGEPSWYIEQYRRVEASCDWVMGEAYNQGRIPWIGNYSIAGTNVTFTNFIIEGEDFRYGWRTILNYLWHGPPTRTWNPTNHTYTAASNTYNRDMALRTASFLHHPENAPFNSACYGPGTVTPTISYGGTSNVKWIHSMFGNSTNGNDFTLNFAMGAQSPSAVVGNNWDLMSQMFRQCVIEFDDYNNYATQRYLTAKPRYFHEWFRLLGMLVLTGNFQNPLDFAAGATQSNMKVYKAIDKTYAYPGDTITYTISYRNYSKAGATNVSITDNLPAGLSFISASHGGTPTGSTVTWNIGNVTGFLSGGLAATVGAVTLKVKVEAAATGRLCNVAVISTSNGTGWTSNEYPNNITDVMERNCVDILSQKPLSLTKTVSLTSADPGDVLNYTLTVKNKSVPFLNGGRQGVIIAGAHDGLPASGQEIYLKYRIYHGAHEPLINYRNYRVSYYLKQTPIPVWSLATTVNEGCSGIAPKLTQQALTVGATWNHRFILTFPNQRATITPMMYARYNSPAFIHEGAMEPMRLISRIYDGVTVGKLYNWSLDWSAEPGINSGDATPYFPIANDWTDPLLPDQPVTKIHPNQCGTITTTIKKQLAEEWDGYTWRRIYGDAPVSGRELTNIVVKDILPPGVTFGGWETGYPVGTLSGSNITWPTTTQLLVNDSIVYKFWVTVNPCAASSTSDIINTATAKAVNEPLVTATATTNSSCVLPVTLIDFNGKMQSKKALLFWSTSSEINNDYFLVERSDDGIHFEVIGKVKGSGTSNQTNSYSFIDKSAINGTTYYRLAQTDYDASIQYSKVISLNSNSSTIRVYPNPFEQSLSVMVSSSEKEKVNVKISNAAGQEIYSSQEHYSNEAFTINSEWASGVYILEIILKDKAEKIKIVKNE